MKIKTKQNGEILVAGEENNGVEYNKELPEDFISTFSLGKYKFIDGEIIEDKEFAMPERDYLEI